MLNLLCNPREIILCHITSITIAHIQVPFSDTEKLLGTPWSLPWFPIYLLACGSVLSGLGDGERREEKKGQDVPKFERVLEREGPYKWPALRLPWWFCCTTNWSRK